MCVIKSVNVRWSIIVPVVIPAECDWDARLWHVFRLSVHVTDPQFQFCFVLNSSRALRVSQLIVHWIVYTTKRRIFYAIKICINFIWNWSIFVIKFIGKLSSYLLNSISNETKWIVDISHWIVLIAKSMKAGAPWKRHSKFFFCYIYR